MNNKKLIELITLAVVAVWVFCIVLIISYKAVVSKAPEETAPITTYNYLTMAPATTTEPPSTLPMVTIDGNNITAAPDIDKPQWLIDEEESKKAAEESKKAEEESKKAQLTTTTKPYVPEGKKEIISAYISAVNKLKSSKNFTLTKDDSLNAEIDEITGGDAIKQVADKLMTSNTNKGKVTYTFKDGMDYETGKSPSQVIAPLGVVAALDESCVKSAVATPGMNGSYTVRIELNRQVQTLNTPAPGYSTSMEVVDINTLGLTSTMTVTTLNITYDESYIEAKIDKNGNLTSMKHYLKAVETVGEGKFAIIPASLRMHGEFTSLYVVVY